MPALNQNAITIIATSGVDMNLGTAQEIFAIPADTYLVVTHIIVMYPDVELDTASYSFGFTGAAYDDVIADATHVELINNNQYVVIPVKDGAKMGEPGEALNILVNILQGEAASATVVVLGYLIT